MIGETVRCILCVKNVREICEILFFFSFSLFAGQVFKESTFGKNVSKKNKGAPFCFLPRAPQTLATPLWTR